MDKTIETDGFFPQLATSGRIVLATLTMCALLYPLLILGIGQVFTPSTAGGSLIRDDRGGWVGSDRIAQGFSRPDYVWPRPSATDYNAAAAAGSNLSPTNPKLRARAEAILAKMNHAGKQPIPADLVSASGSGLDPHITLRGAEYQAERVAAARNLPVQVIMGILREHAERPGGIFSEAVVNVLRVNMALDRYDR